MFLTDSNSAASTICLEHQLPEDQPSSVGLICRECKSQLLAKKPRGRCLAFWESQPVAYSLDQQPRFAYTLVWPDFRIRSLHWNGEGDSNCYKHAASASEISSATN